MVTILARSRRRKSKMLLQTRKLLLPRKAQVTYSGRTKDTSWSVAAWFWD